MTYRIKLLILAILAISLVACGSDKAGSGSSNDVSASKGCITGGCHEMKASKVTGNAIGAEWNASSHKATNIAGCTTCHGHYHSNSCGECHGGAQLQSPQQNSLDAEVRCLDCHVTAESLMKGLDYRHLPELSPKYRLNSGFNYYSAVGYVTMRGTQYESKCIWCHNPHDNRVLPQHEDWAESGHGDTNTGAFASRNTDFKTRGSVADWSQAPGDNCVRCHTASGYINLVTSGMKNISPWGLSSDGKTPISFTRQSLYCNVCHDNGSGKSYGYNLREIPALGSTGGLRVYQNFSAGTGTLAVPVTGREVVPVVTDSDVNKDEPFANLKIINNYIDFSNQGISDRCVLCHSGRGSGQLIKLAAISRGSNGNSTNFRRMNRIGVHDFAGAGTMFRALGFEFYSSYHYTPPADIPYAHDRIGSGYPGTGSRGPCVSCHMSGAESHLFEAVTYSAQTSSLLSTLANNYPVASINTALCSTCHASGGIGFSRFNGTVTALNEKKVGYSTALKSLLAWLSMKGISSTSNWLRQSSYPLPTSVATPAAMQALLQSEGAVLTTYGLDQTVCMPNNRWSDVDLGMRNMGASMNQNYLINDPAGYVHNDLYVKRLIYDSIDWVDNCVLDKSVEMAIRLTQNDRTDNAVLFLLTSYNSSGTAATRDYRLTAEEVNAAINYLMDAPGGDRPGGM